MSGVASGWAVLALAALGVMSCRRAGGPAAIRLDVTPSARVTPRDLAAGGPLAVDYRWTVGAAPPPGAYRAFVHFLDDEGALLFTDDHEPQPAVNEWRAGRTYVYRRLLLSSEFPYAGTVTVVMGLYQPELGRRVALRGDDIGQLRYRAASLQLRPRDRDLPLHCDGLYPPEASARAPLVVTRFMRLAAECRFPNPHEDVVLFVQGDIEPNGFKEPPVLGVAASADPAVEYRANLQNTRELQLVRVRIPARRVGREPEVGLRLSMSAAYVPRALGAGDDGRELSLRIYGLELRRLSRLEPDVVEGAGSLP
jgi:hypothetical protein